MMCRRHGKKFWTQAYQLCLVSACLWASDCAPHADKIVISRIVVDVPAAIPGLQTQREAFRDAITTRLRADASVKASPNIGADSRDPGTQPGTHVMQVIWSALHKATLEVRLRPTRLGGSELSTLAEIVGDATSTEDVLAAFDVAWSAIGRMRQLDRGSDKRMVQALRDDDVRMQQFAIVRLGERRVRAAVKPLCKMLAAQTDLQMVYRIMGALVAIGDARAVTPLIDLARKKDDAFLSQVVFAVGAIGGRTARAYLVVLASGHPDEEVQRSAKDALDELLQKQPAASR